MIGLMKIVYSAMIDVLLCDAEPNSSSHLEEQTSYSTTTKINLD